MQSFFIQVGPDTRMTGINSPIFERIIYASLLSYVPRNEANASLNTAVLFTLYWTATSVYVLV